MSSKFNSRSTAIRASRVALMVKNLPASADDIRDTGSIPGLGTSPGGERAAYSSILAWIIPWMEELGGLQSRGLQRVKCD